MSKIIDIDTGYAGANPFQKLSARCTSNELALEAIASDIKSLIGALNMQGMLLERALTAAGIDPATAVEEIKKGIIAASQQKPDEPASTPEPPKVVA
jgi:hypothetical protein